MRFENLVYPGALVDIDAVDLRRAAARSNMVDRPSRDVLDFDSDPVWNSDGRREGAGRSVAAAMVRRVRSGSARVRFVPVSLISPTVSAWISPAMVDFFPGAASRRTSRSAGVRERLPALCQRLLRPAGPPGDAERRGRIAPCDQAPAEGRTRSRTATGYASPHLVSTEADREPHDG